MHLPFCRRKSLPSLSFNLSSTMHLPSPADANLCSLSLSFNLSSTFGRVQARAQQWPCLSLPVAKVDHSKGHAHAIRGRARPPVTAPLACTPATAAAWWPRTHAPSGHGGCLGPSSPRGCSRVGGSVASDIWSRRSDCCGTHHGCTQRLRPHLASSAAVPLPCSGRPCPNGVLTPKRFLPLYTAVREASFWVDRSFTVHDPDDRIGLVFG